MLQVGFLQVLCVRQIVKRSIGWAVYVGTKQQQECANFRVKQRTSGRGRTRIAYKDIEKAKNTSWTKVRSMSDGG